MRVLVVHNRHRSARPSGANTAMQGDVRLLAEAGVEVETYVRSNDEIDTMGPRARAALALRPLRSRGDEAALRRVVRRFRPQVAHVHNVYPLLSPGVVSTLQGLGVPVVHTVHDYLRVCATGHHFRDGHICFDCRGRAFPWPAAVHGCYRGRPASAVMAAAIAVHRGTWRGVDHHIAVSAVVAEHLVDTGVPRERITVRGNVVDDPGPPRPPGTDFLVAGTLSQEKGTALLLDAWERSGLGGSRRLVIAGDGPLRGAAEAASRRLPGITVLGPVPHERIAGLVADAAVVVAPSLFNETFGMTVVEAFAAGRPVIATAVGAPATMVDAEVGWVVAADAAALAGALADAARGTGSRGAAARERYLRLYSPPALLRSLQEVYARVTGLPSTR